MVFQGIKAIMTVMLLSFAIKCRGVCCDYDDDPLCPALCSPIGEIISNDTVTASGDSTSNQDWVDVDQYNRTESTSGPPFLRI